MAFKMKGFGGFGNSPMRKNKENITYGDKLYNYDGTVNKKDTKEIYKYIDNLINLNQ